jgi:hypothetical protein
VVRFCRRQGAVRYSFRYAIVRRYGACAIRCRVGALVRR